MKALVAVLMAFAVVGCSKDPNNFFASPAAVKEKRDAEIAAKIQAEDSAKCTNFGFTPGTPAFGSCRLELERNRTELERARIAAESSARSRELPPGTMQPSVTCTTQRYGSYQSQTTCY